VVWSVLLIAGDLGHMSRILLSMLCCATLIASIYGTNFKHMPELDWANGYPFALVLMLASVAIPFWLFHRKGWLK